MNSTTITLFKERLKGCGRNSKDGEKKGGIKAHTISNMVSVVRGNLMNYVNIYRFLENPEGCLQAIMKENEEKYRTQPTLFPQNKRALKNGNYLKNRI